MAMRPTGEGGRFVSLPLVDRLADGFDIIGDCWIWQGRPSRNGGGYGQVSIAQNGRTGTPRVVHVVVYELLVGPIPEGLQLDHLCRQPMCINPDHLEPVTARENVRRSDNPMGINARKTHCINGHPLTDENVYHPAKHPERRACRICQRDHHRKWLQKQEKN